MTIWIDAQDWMFTVIPMGDTWTVLAMEPKVQAWKLLKTKIPSMFEAASWLNRICGKDRKVVMV